VFEARDDGVLVPRDAGDVEAAEWAPRVQMLSWLCHLDLRHFQFMLWDSNDWDPEVGCHLNQLMLISRQAEVTDPLDRVYAYLGLAAPGHDILPDYGPAQTPERVFGQATRAILRMDQALNVLSFAEEGQTAVQLVVPLTK
jgi:hypothetical protein